MLQKLSILNYTLITKTELDFNNGLTVITGETGAGKSIIFGAIELLFGARASTKVLKDPNSKCIIEGIFSQNDQLINQLLNLDLDVSNELIIRREIRKNGNSRSFINDSPVKIENLKIISQYLIEINGQHLFSKMGSLKFKYDFIDSFLKQNRILSEYKTAFKEYTISIEKQNSLRKRASVLNEKKDFLNFQLTELSSYDIENWDEESIQNDYNIVSNQEEINSILSKINKLYTEKQGILELLDDLISYSNNFLEHVSNFSSIDSRIQSAKIEIEDIFHEINSNFEPNDPDKYKLQELDDLLSKINYLVKKFNVVDLNSLINKKQTIVKELSEFTELDLELNQANQNVEFYKSKCLKLGQELFKKRLKNIPTIEKNINSILEKLSMGHADFRINLTLGSEITVNGTDQISLLVAVNNSSKYYPIHQFSSGGELSRVALAMKHISSTYSSISSLIFDEIDSGISGKVASEVGRLLKDISLKTQVINISHLPQVAAIANHHLNVSKTDFLGKMESEISYLKKEDRIQVLAKMLGGDKTGKAALNNAIELLN